MRHQQHQRQAAERRGSLAEAAALWAELHGTVDELHQAVAGFVHTYNTQWLIGRLGHHTPKGAYQAATTTAAAGSGRPLPRLSRLEAQHLLVTDLKAN